MSSQKRSSASDPIRVDEALLGEIEAAANRMPFERGAVHRTHRDADPAYQSDVWFGPDKRVVMSRDRSDCEYVARMDPPTVLALCAEVRRLREDLRKERERCGYARMELDDAHCRERDNALSVAHLEQEVSALKARLAGETDNAR